MAASRSSSKTTGFNEASRRSARKRHIIEAAVQDYKMLQ